MDDKSTPNQKECNLNTSLSKEYQKGLAANGYCSVPILQKVLVPAPGYETRLYSVQLMNSSEADDYYTNISKKWAKEELLVQNERERSPMRGSRTGVNNWSPLEYKELKHYKA